MKTFLKKKHKFEIVLNQNLLARLPALNMKFHNGGKGLVAGGNQFPYMHRAHVILAANIPMLCVCVFVSV